MGDASRRPLTRFLAPTVAVVLLSTLISVISAIPAAAAGTVLFQNTFYNRTVDGVGTVTKPATASGATNVACLTATGNTATAPLLSCTASTDAQGSGKLRLTPASGSQAGGIYGATSFPTSNGLDVTFNSYQYGGSSADGIAFALAAVDPANPTPPTTIGPSGGSLGYSTSGGVAGLPNAYLGVGLDVYGNFSAPGTAQGSGCGTVTNITAQVAGAVVVRGPGTGTVGYCGLNTTYAGTAGTKYTLRALTRAASVVPVQVLINPSAATFTSDTGQSVSPGTYKVIATPVGSTPKVLTGSLPTVASTFYPSTSWVTAAGIPKQLVFGFVGSTGGATDFHEISDVKVLTFNAVPQLAVSSTSYSAATTSAGGPVNYVINTSVLSGVDEASAVSVTQTTPAGVLPVGAYGTGWVCATPSGQTVTCTTSASSIANGTALPSINVVAVATAAVTAATIQSSSTTTASSSDANPASDTTMDAGTLPTTPAVTAATPAIGSIAGGTTVTISGTTITAATAIEIGTTAQQQAGTPVTLLPCPAGVTSSCFAVSGSTLLAYLPARATAASVNLTVVTLGVASAVGYVYAGPPAVPAAPTATAGVTSATVSWTAPAANGSPITGYTVTPYLAGVAQTPISYDATATARTLTGLTAGGSYTFTVAATNAYGTSATSAASTAVVPYTVPTAPTITAATAGDSQATVTWTAPASTGSSPITGYTVTPYIGAVAQTPQSFSGTATTQLVTGLTPGTAYTFRVAAVNAAGTGPQSANSTAVTPNQSPTLNFAAPPAGEVGVAYSNQLVVTNGTAPFAWSVSTGALPAGLTLNPTTGLLSGTPTASGTFTFTALVTDASGQTASKSVSLVIAAAPVVTFTPAAGEVSVAYSQQPTLTGGTAPISWSITAGSLPAGVTINAGTGLISGTPTVSGSFTVTVTATDAFGQAANRTATIVIAALPTFTFTPPTAATLAVAYSTTFTVAGGTSPLTWSVVTGSVPPGLSLASGTGVLSGIPTVAGSYPFTVSVLDAFGQATTRAVTLYVNAGPLVITKTANVSSAVPGGVVAYTITVTNSAALPFSVTVTDPLSGVLDDATYNANATATTGSVSYAAPTLSWTGTVAAGGSATITYSVTVSNPVTGNKVLANTVSSATLGTNCASGSTDTRCTAAVTVSGLTITKTADVATTTPGGTVRFTVVVTNSGQTPYAGATFTDPLIAALDDAVYNADATATAGSLTYAGSALTWTGNLAVGATATVSYTVTVANPDNGDRSLTGTVVSATAGSSCPSGNAAASCTATVPVLVPALSITNSANVGTTTPGGVVSYTLTLSNTGQTAYTGASVTLALAGALDDAVYDNNAVASAGNVSYSSGNLVWTGNLALAAVVTVTFTVTANSPAGGDRTMTTVATSSAAGSTCAPGGSATACTSTVQVLVPALTVTSSADVTSTTPGSIVRYTVSVTNTGQTAYTGATFTDNLSGVLDDAVYDTDVAATSGTATYGSSAVTWTGNLAIGATATITYSITVRNPDPGNLSMVRTLTSTTPFNNCASGSSDTRCTNTVTVLLPALTVTDAVSSPTTTPGSVVTYTVTIANTGQTPYGGATVALNLSGVLDDARYNSDATFTTGSVVVSGGTVTWTGGLAVGATATGTLTVTVNNPDNGDRTLTTTVVSDAAGSTCPTGSAAGACRTSTTVLIPGLTITKTANVSTITPGGTVNYTIVVLNSGQTAYTAASFTDSLATVLTDATYSGNAAATSGSVGYGAPTLSWTGALAVGASATITYSVVVKNPDPGDKQLDNSVVSNSPGSNCANGSTDTRCRSTVVVTVPGLTIVKTANAATTAPGSTVAFTVTVTNSGATNYPAATFGDVLTDVTDDAVYNADAAATAGAVSLSGSTLTWTGALAVGASATITYTVTVRQAAGGNNLIVNPVSSTSSGSNCAAGSGDTRCTVTVPVARLVLAQAYTESSTTPGSLVHLTATFTNTGQVPYTGISVSSPSAGVLDDATAAGDQTATSGTLELTSTAIVWTGNIPVGGVVTVTGTLTVNNPDAGDKLLTGTLVSTAPGNNCASGTSDTRCTANLSVLIPSLTISKSASATSTVPGGTVSFTITITNSGQTTYTGITVTDGLTGTLDDAVYNNNATATSGSVSYTNPNLNWTGTLAAGATATVTYSVTVNNPDTGDKTLINPVSSTAVGSSCPPASGSAACRTTVAVLTPGLTFVKTASASTTYLSTAVTFTITVTNSGQTAYAPAVLTDSLTAVLDDANYNAGSETATAGTVTYTAATKVLSWSGALAVGASATITFAVTTKASGLGDRTMTNTVVSTSTGSNCGSGSSDTRCTAVVTVANTTALTVVNTADVVAAPLGTVVRYTITVTVTGLGLVPSFSQPLSGILDDATYNGDIAATAGLFNFTGTGNSRTLNWAPVLAFTGTAVITFSVTVNPTATGDQLLTGTLTSAILASQNCGSGSTDARCTTTVPVAALILQQSYTETSTTPGSLVHLTATFTNTGKYPYFGITVTSPSAGTLDDATASGDQTATTGSLTLTASAIVWTGDIPVGGTVTVTGTLTVNNPDAGDKLLTGKLVSTALGNNCLSTSTDTRCTASLAVLIPALTISKTANTTFVVPGGTAGYTITLVNTGQTAYTGAVVSDTLVGVLDDAVYNANAVASAGSVSYLSPVLTWTGNLAVGATVTITYSVTANNPATGDKTMSNPVQSTAVGSTCLPASGAAACHTTVAVLTPELTVAASANTATTIPGAVVSYTVTATNTGQTPYAAAGITMPLSNLLDDATYSSASATTGTVLLSGQNLNWSGALAVGAAVTVTFGVTVNNPVGGNYRLLQTVTSTTPGSTCAVGANDSRCTTDIPIASLQIVNVASGSTAKPTDVVSYTATLTNLGQVPYVGITATDHVAGALDDATYNGDAAATSGSVIVVTGSGQFVWTGDIPVGGTVVVTGSVTVKNPDLGNKTLSTYVDTSAAATNCPVGNLAAACSNTVTVLTPGLTLSKTANTTTTTPGSTVGYTVTIVNTGQTAYTAAVVRDSLAQLLSDAQYDGNAVATSGSVSYASSTLTWTGNVAVAQTVVITYSVTVNNPDLGDRNLQNTVVSDELGSNCPTGSSAAACTVTVTVLVPALAISITANTTTTTPGATVGYTVTIANTGQTPYAGAATAIALAGVLDDATGPTGAAATVGTVTFGGSTLNWTGNLAIGATAVVTYAVTVRNPDPGNLQLSTAVSSAAPGSTCTAGAPCTNTVTVLIPGLSITAAATPATTTPGGTAAFTVTIANTGQTAYVGTVVTTSLAGLLDDATFNGVVSATAGAVSYSAPDITWTGSLAVGATAVLTFSAVVANPDTGNRAVAISVAGEAAGSTCTAASAGPNCRASVTVLVPRLTISLTASTPTTTPGGLVGYTIIIVNSGETAYTGAVVTNSLAGVLTDAVYNGDVATVGGGTVGYANSTLTWTGNVAIGASVTVTYSTTVRNPDPGDRLMNNSVSSNTPGSSCPPVGAPATCSTAVQVLIPALTITKTADRSSVVAGSAVAYTIVIRNTGETGYAPATVSDPLAAVLDDAAYSGDATATIGSVQLISGTLVWTGALPVGATATVSYTVTTLFPATGNRTLTNSVSSAAPGATCSTGNEAGCSTGVTVLVPGLAVSKTANTAQVVAGGVVRYTVSATNTGAAAYPGLTLTDALAGVLDDASYAGDGTATSGTLTLSGSTLTWTGNLPIGATVVIGYSVNVPTPVTGDGVLVNRISTTATGSNCAPASTDPACVSTVAVNAQTITLSGLTESFTLTGPPSSTVTGDGIVTMTVITNSPGGYVVTVQAATGTLTPATAGNTDTIPIANLLVRETNGTTFQPLSASTSRVVHVQSSASNAGGDAVSNDFRVQIPYVSSDTYSATLDYIVTAQ